MGFPPPPPDYSPPKTRPSVVTKYAMIGIISSIVAMLIGAIDLALNPGEAWIAAVGVIAIVMGVFYLIVSFALFVGQSWAVTLSGYNSFSWANMPEVRAFFGRSPPYPAIPQAAPQMPPPPLCPTCGQPLTYVQQYNRWFCQREQKYV